MSKMQLSSETELAEIKGRWLSTYNIVYLIILVVFILIGLSKDDSLGMSVTAGLIVCLGAFIVKEEIARVKRKWSIDSYSFALDSNLTTEEIGEKVAYPLMNKGFETTFENGSMIFKGKTTSYTFIRDEAAGSFRLEWYYTSIGKIFSPFRWQFITDYREMLNEVGSIAYHIQQAAR